MNFPESDWKTLREVKAAALERFCQGVLSKCEAIWEDEEATAHDRYLRLFKFIRARDAELARAFDDHRRSTAFGKLIVMRSLGLVTDEEMEGFSQETRESVKSVVSMSGLE